MSVAVGVVAHTARLTQALALLLSVGPDWVSVDDGELGCTGNHLTVWAALLERRADWLVVVEDDAVPCDDFREQLEHALAVAPTDIVGLYLGRTYPVAGQMDIAHVRNDPAHWALSTQLRHAVGTAMRAELVDDMLHSTDRGLPIDEAITQWAKARGHLVGYTRPSLLNHADTAPLITARADGAPRDSGPRTAWAHGGRPAWNSTTVALGQLPGRAPARHFSRRMA
ncbi:glycosyltransferase family 25 protein [Mycolicibacterium sphagni]|uniref:glycosyltransferase family 25 protein n=1 Tax=Mycolicibacterium sphagni TaxID=1786 RepID=UPI000DA16E8A|nr:glycosyltransferase family 25 protein [Mycolicibacterium sphagni]